MCHKDKARSRGNDNIVIPRDNNIANSAANSNENVPNIVSQMINVTTFVPTSGSGRPTERERTAATDSSLNTAHTQQHRTKRSISPVSRGSSSAAARGRPRGQRAVVDSASTSVRSRSVRARRHQSRRRRRRGTALLATNDCDADVPHVAHS